MCVDVNFIEAVAERDVDLLLLEEFHVSKEFQGWFAERVFGSEGRAYRFKDAWHSVSDPKWGESDLLVTYESQPRAVVAILLENKIDAVCQPEQALRYQKRGEVGVQERRWMAFRTCIVAPRKYIESGAGTEGYQAMVTYEDLLDFFLSFGESDRRYQYRARLVREAIEQSRRGYTRVPHEDVTQFWQRYWELLRCEFSELSMNAPKDVPFNSDWPRLRTRGARGSPQVVHKLRQGYVDLELPSKGERVQDIREKNVSVLDPDMIVEQTGKSASIRVSVPSIDRLGTFDNQIEAVRAGLRAAQRLLEVSPKLSIP